MSLIKFPSHIKPSRVTVQLQRVDEIFASPLTNIQQVVSRGNPAWRWTYEYRDISQSEREVVQAFLMNCRGSLNTFKVSDPGDYSIRGSLSDWIDVFSGYGSFTTDAGSTASKVNSWFSHDDGWVTHITDEKTALVEIRQSWATDNIQWIGHGANGLVNSLGIGNTYLHRIKSWNHTNSHFMSLVVGSAGDIDLLQNAPGSDVYSDGVISAPFVAHNSSHFAAVYDSSTLSRLGEQYEYADYCLKRCAMLVKSENLCTYSNSFGAADWGKNQCTVAHYNDHDPLGGNDKWLWFVNSDESNAAHTLSFNAITKANTTDLFTVGIHAKVGNGLDGIRIQLDDGTSDAYADFDLSVNSVFAIDTDSVFRRAHGKLWDVGSGYYRLQFTAFVSSHSTLDLSIIAINSQGGGTVFTTTDTSYIEIAGASIVKFPLLKPYFETWASEIVGTGTLTGSTMFMDGFDAEDIIKAGTRIEIINQYHDENNDNYERSEFKRITNEVRVKRDGHALISFDPPIRNEPLATFDRPSTGQQTLHPAVIFHQPEMKARLLNGTIQYIDKPLQMTDVVFDVIEDLTE